MIEPLEITTKRAVLRAIVDANYRPGDAARALRVSPQTLRNMLRRWHVALPCRANALWSDHVSGRRAIDELLKSL